MNPIRIARLGVIAIVIAAVAVILRLKQVEPPSPVSGPPESIPGAIPIEPSTAAPLAARPGIAPEAAPAGFELPPAAGAIPRLLDFGANRCIPCKKMAPILEALREDFAGQFEVVFIDVWENRQAAGPYGIKLIPTQVFFDEDGDELFRHEGFFSREDILATWSDLGYAFGAPSGEESG